MAQSADHFVCYVFHAEPSAAPLAKTIEAACKLRYQVKKQPNSCHHCCHSESFGCAFGPYKRNAHESAIAWIFRKTLKQASTLGCFCPKRHFRRILTEISVNIYASNRNKIMQNSLYFPSAREMHFLCDKNCIILIKILAITLWGCRNVRVESPLESLGTS